MCVCVFNFNVQTNYLLPFSLFPQPVNFNLIKFSDMMFSSNGRTNIIMTTHYTILIIVFIIIPFYSIIYVLLILPFKSDCFACARPARTFYCDVSTNLLLYIL